MIDFFLVKLGELLRMQEDFIEELTVTGLFPEFLARTHLLLKAVKGACFFLAACIDLGALVKFTVY